MNDFEDDSWVREFGVSNPQKTHAGYTVYRVSSKVYPKGFPEAASEVIVFKRYSEIRALYKDLKIIYENINLKKKKFPRFAKGHYFDRFDESVIEERQKQALSLLLFAGNIPFLFTSQPFVKFFEGGVEHSSQGSVLGDTEQAVNKEITDSETPSPEDYTGNGDIQPWAPELYFSEKQDSSDDETIYEINKDLSNTDLSLSFNAGENDKTWLSHAISLCSEGDDIEILASEAGLVPNSVEDARFISDEAGTSNMKPDHLPSQGSIDMLPTLLESGDECEEDVFVETVSSSDASNSGNKSSIDCHRSSTPVELENTVNKPGSDFREETDSSLGHQVDSKNFLFGHNDVSNLVENIETSKDLVCSNTYFDNKRNNEESHEIKNSNKVDDRETLSNKSSPIEEVKAAHKKVVRAVSNIAVSWIDPKKKDYLYHAAQIIQRALYYEANEMYEEAFNKYKICVGVLLNGVQHDSDGNRREAVRRKTAQYLVKAEFLFNTYLKHDDNDMKDWSVKPRSSSEHIGDRNVVDRQFGHVTLASLKVIGVVGKNMLVQSEGLEGVYVIKALHKTNAVHRSSRQENKQSSKSYAKKYVSSTRMVKLHRHFDTNDSILLLLEYAAGGCLWNHLKTFRRHFCDSHETFGLPHKYIGSSDDSSDINEFTSGVVEYSTRVAGSTSDITGSTSDAAESTFGVDKSTYCISDFSSDVAEPISSVDESTSGLDQRNSCEIVFSSSLDCDKDSGNSKETFKKNCSRENILSSSTAAFMSENDSLNRENENAFAGDAASTAKEDKTIMLAHRIAENEKLKQTTCSSIGSETRVNENKAKHVVFETGETRLANCGNLLAHLDHATSNDPVIDKCVQRWIAEMVLALNSVHSLGIILKDLKPSNVLLDGNGRVKLSYSGVWEEVDNSVDPEAVEQLYCAPEVFRGEKITFAADWWSLGVLSYELITGKTLCSMHPWGIYPHSSILFPSQDISAEARSFLSGLICHNSTERLDWQTMKMIYVRHTFFSKKAIKAVGKDMIKWMQRCRSLLRGQVVSQRVQSKMYVGDKPTTVSSSVVRA